MNKIARKAVYEKQNKGAPLTPRQIRRIKHKSNRALKKVMKGLS